MTGFPAPQDIQAAFAAVLVDEWLRAGLTDAVVCPGSRSTPMLVALADAAELGALKLHVVLDERGAGFFALGLGQASGVPAAVVTTSGTAAAELHPAIVEADHAGVPLLAVTADRPAELHDCGAPQTVHQVGLYGASVRWELCPGVPDLAAAGSWRSWASRAVAEAYGGVGRPGPVHVNLAFREPLLGSAAALLGTSSAPAPGPAAAAGPTLAPAPAARPAPAAGPTLAPAPAARPALAAGPTLAPAPAARPALAAGPTLAPAPAARPALAAGPAPAAGPGPAGGPGPVGEHLVPAHARLGRAGGAPWHRVIRPIAETAAAEAAPAAVVERLAAAGERGLIVAGRGAGAGDAVWELSRATSWPVLADPLSGCRWPGAIAAADALVRAAPVRDWRPDMVLRLGAPWASRVLNEWLARLDCPQVLVDPGGTWAAPDRLPDEVVVARPEAVCLAVAAAVGVPLAPTSWATRWARAEELAQIAIEAAVEGDGAMTEPGIARALVCLAPSGSTLVVSSSMPVREVEWWSVPRQGLRVLANRGANGIDGVLSTALGVAASASTDGGRVTALLGDLAFLYDAGALLWAAERDLSLDVVVVDNDGGGIFNFLAQRTSQPRARFERLWGTPHGADLCAVARSYGVEAARVPDLKSLTDCLGEPRDRGLRVLVATTDREANVTLHQRLNEAVAGALLEL